MSYRAPVRDMRFVLEELADIEGILALPGFEELSTELVAAVLEESARFVEQVLAPLNHSGDQAPAQWKDGEVATSPGFKQAYAQFAAAGWQGLQHEARWGGQGLPQLVGAAAVENLNTANLSFSLCPLLTDGVIEALGAIGSENLQKRFIPPLIQGRWTGTMNLTEPQAGSDLSLLTTRAVRQDDDAYRLTGQKIFITYGEHDMAENIVHLVLARTPDAPKGVKGISLFVVPKFLVDDDGGLGARNDVWCASIEHKMGIHASPTAVLLYGSDKGDVGEGAIGYLVGQENHGLQYMFVMMNAARFAVGVQGIAVSERALQQAVHYAGERIQGQALDGSSQPVPINRHPDVQRMLLTMRGLVEAGRALAYMGASALDRARHSTDDAERVRQQALHDYLVPIIKGFCTENAVEVASLGVQVHGGMGYVEETGAAQYYRDARILPIYEGTTAIQANDLLGRKTWRDAGGVAKALAEQMRSTVQRLEQAASGAEDHTDGVALIARRLADGIDAYEQAVGYMLDSAKQGGRAAFLGSVPYLMLSGTVLGGWQMARAALACVKKLQDEDADPFYRQKLATCVFYAAHVLPRAQAWRTAIQEGEIAAFYARQAQA